MAVWRATEDLDSELGSNSDFNGVAWDFSAEHYMDTRTLVESNPGLVGLAKALAGFPSANARSAMELHPASRMG